MCCTAVAKARAALESVLDVDEQSRVVGNNRTHKSESETYHANLRYSSYWVIETRETRESNHFVLSIGKLESHTSSFFFFRASCYPLIRYLGEFRLIVSSYWVLETRESNHFLLSNGWKTRVILRCSSFFFSFLCYNIVRRTQPNTLGRGASAALRPPWRPAVPVLNHFG